MSGLLGCGVTRVYLQTRGGDDVLLEVPWESVSYGRKLNEISTASVTIGQAGFSDEECCWALSTLDAWEHELAIWRDDELVWVGPIGDPKYNLQGTTVPAKDLFAWFERRWLPFDRTFRAADLGTIFSQLASDALSRDNSMDIVVSAAHVGVIAARDVHAAERPRAADHMREVGRSGLDWTMLARTLLAGGEEVPTVDLGVLVDDNLLEPDVEVRGSLAATEVAVTGSSGGGEHEPVVGVAGVGVDARLGLLQQTFQEQDIKDDNSALYAATARYEQLQTPPMYVSADLDPNTSVAFSDLIPGARVDIVADIGCRRVNQAFRLLDVGVSAKVSDKGETEVVSATFVPQGVTSLGS